MIRALLSIVITLILVVGLHEAGHAIAAWFFAVDIKRIGIGFGRPLLCYKSRSGIEWVWGWVPIGGYVELLDNRISPEPVSKWPVCFDKKSIWVRCIILLSGGAINVIVAWLGFTLFYMIGHADYPPKLSAINSQSIVSKAGFQVSDRIIEFNNKPIDSWQTVGMQLIGSLGLTKVPVKVVNKDGQQRLLYLDLSQPMVSEKTIWKSLGFEPDIQQKEQISAESFGAAIRHALYTVVMFLQFYLVMIKQLLIGRVPIILLLGPVGLFDTVITSFAEGLGAFSYFIASFSLAVGLVNLFPIPGLDGGSIVYALIEKCRGKPMSIALEVLLYRLSRIAFWVFLVQLIVNDAQRYLH